MDRYEVVYEGMGKFQIYKNDKKWVSTDDKEIAEDLIRVLIISTIAGSPVQIEDDVENSNWRIVWDGSTRSLHFVEND